MPVVAQVSDLHLSPRVPERQQQAELVLAGINAAKPDLTVVTGDLTDDGWDRPEDLVWAKQWMDERLDGDWFAVPGNHDVGNFVSVGKGVVTEHRLTHWQTVFGEAPCRRLSGWDLHGINSMIYCGMNMLEVAVNCSLQHALNLAKQAGVYSACFMHTPMFVDAIEEPQDPAIAYWLGDWHSRKAMWKGLSANCVRLVTSGHVHQTHNKKVNDTRIVWAPPASGTWVHAPGLPNPPAPEQTGFVLHHLGDDGSVRSEVVACAPMLKTVFYDPTASG